MARSDRNKRAGIYATPTETNLTEGHLIQAEIARSREVSIRLLALRRCPIVRLPPVAEAVYL
ncbi:hypothetical protein DESC_190157 [Desulfosarcina cetonica]|nr:hypothetical protein DESC_190157 [Desulfosarcina cetonica]